MNWRRSLVRLAVPATIVVGVVVSLVAAGWWNRSGPPRLSLTLTDRELSLDAAPRAPGDQPGHRLHVLHEFRLEPIDSRNWLSESRLREIGFSMDGPAGARDAANNYPRVPARVAWIVFEYAGPAWRDLERRRALIEAPLALSPPAERHDVRPRSRLVPVDAGADLDALIARYPQGHLIVSGRIQLAYLSPERGGPLVYGSLVELVPSTLAVPASFNYVFDAPLPDLPRANQGRYEVDVAIGRLGWPYVVSARPRLAGVE